MIFDNYLKYLVEGSDVFETTIEELKKKVPGKELDKFEKKVREFRKATGDKAKLFKEMFGVEAKEDEVDKEIEKLKVELDDVVTFSRLKGMFNRLVSSGKSKEEALKTAKEEVLPKREEEKKEVAERSKNINIAFASSDTKLDNFVVKIIPNAKTIMWKKGDRTDRNIDIDVSSSFKVLPKIKDKLFTMPSLYSKNEDVLKEEITKMNEEIKKIVEKETSKLDKELKAMGFVIKDVKEPNFDEEGEEWISKIMY